jgi:hypothetical protein
VAENVVQDARAAAEFAGRVLAANIEAGKIEEELVAPMLRHESAYVRGLGVSMLPADRVKLLDVAGSDPSAFVRAAAMRRLADPGAKDLLLKSLESDDPFVQQAARLGLRNSLTTAEIVALVDSTDALSRSERQPYGSWLKRV